jgi:hypothetical protein
MASFDFANLINVQTSRPVRLVTGNTDSAAIDTLGYEGIAVIYGIGQTINGNPQMNIAFRVSEDTNVSNSVAIDSAYITKNPVIVNTVNTFAWAGIACLGNSEDTRYVFPQIVANASNFNAVVFAVLGNPHSVPTT